MSSVINNGIAKFVLVTLKSKLAITAIQLLLSLTASSIDEAFTLFSESSGSLTQLMKRGFSLVVICCEFFSAVGNHPYLKELERELTVDRDYCAALEKRIILAKQNYESKTEFEKNEIDILIMETEATINIKSNIIP